MLNVLSVDRKRWGKGAGSAGYRRSVVLTSGLVIANLLLLNVWLFPLNGLRLDLTSQQDYSLSSTTKELLGNLSEPLLIRGLRQRQDASVARDAEAAAGRPVARVRDRRPGQGDRRGRRPDDEPGCGARGNQTYGIQPSPFQVAGRYEASVINAYFDVLVRYGDQSEVLNFRDLIEVQADRSGEPDVRFRNLEYDLTRAAQAGNLWLPERRQPARLAAQRRRS